MKCRLCDLPRELRSSHIIPKSFYRDLKKNSGQLMLILGDEDTPNIPVNADPKEALLCAVCEDYLNINFEKYGTRLFKSSKGVKKSRNYIEFNGFRYTEYYLFLISILWRASISSIKEFAAIELLKEIENLMRTCILSKSIKLDDNINLDHFIKISIFRVVDSEKIIDDNIIKNILLEPNFCAEENPNDGLAYYFMVNGFFISYFFYVGNTIYDMKSKKIHGQLENRQQIKIPKVELRNLKPLNNVFSSLIKKASKKNERIQNLKTSHY